LPGLINSAVMSQMTFDSDINSSSNAIYTSTYNLSPSGVLNSVNIADGRPRTVTYTNDVAGLVIRRDESDNGSNGDPHEVWYRFNGVQIGYVGNNGTRDMRFEGSIRDRSAKQSTSNGAFRWGATTGVGYAEFDSSYDPINTVRQGAAGGRYIAQGGETLQGIAQATWGDASLWYKIAEANGLSANAPLAAGQALSLPAGVTRTHNNASTFKPYDPAEALGNTSPTTPKPPKKNKCGVFGQVLLAVIQIAVTIALTAVGVPAVPAAMLANIASQGVGVVTGIQQSFSWKSVAITGLTASLAPPGTGNVFADAALNAASNAVVQGIAVATGLQKKFDWAGVAAAGVSAGIGTAVGKIDGFSALGRGAQAAIGGSARLIANAATRSVINGSDFGDNMLAGLPDVIAQTLVAATQDGIEALTSHRDAQHEQMALAGIEDSGGATAAAGATGETADADVLTAEPSYGDAVLRVDPGEKFDVRSLLKDVRGGYWPELPSDAEISDWANGPGDVSEDRISEIIKWTGRLGRVGGFALLATPSATGRYEELPLFGTGTLLSAHWETNPGGLIGDGIFAALTTYPDIYEVATGRNGNSALIDGKNAIVAQYVPGLGHKVGFGVYIGSEREAEIYHEGVANNWSSHEINLRISQERNINGIDPDFNIGDIRYARGTVFASSRLADGGSNWLASGKVPGQVAKLLIGKEFSSAGGLKKAFWRGVAKFRELTDGIASIDIARMARGLAPRADRVDWHGKATSYQLHHQNEIRLGGPVYDLSNIRILSPRAHVEIHRGGK
jgi:hypothetical protein